MIKYIFKKNNNKIYTESNTHIRKTKEGLFHRIRKLIIYYVIIALNFFHRNTSDKRSSSKKVNYILTKIQSRVVLNPDDISMIKKLSYNNIIILIKNCNEQIKILNLQKTAYNTTRHNYVDTISIQTKICYKFRHFIPLTDIDIEQLSELDTNQLIEIIQFYNNCIDGIRNIEEL
jgi:hypothetical protein